MGLMCQILLNRPPEGYFKSGEHVTGVIKYATNTVEQFSDITVSLKGKSRVRWTERRGTGKNRRTVTYVGSEDNVNIKANIVTKQREPNGAFTFEVGSYEHGFDFILPDNIPSSYKDNTCKIIYLIKVKFHRPELLKFTKHFKTEINVRGKVIPTTPDAPITYDIEKKIFKLFTSNNTMINVKTTIENSFLSAGDTAALQFAVTNTTKLIIPSILVQLYCKKKYRSNSGKVKRRTEKIDSCVFNTPNIPDLSTANLTGSIVLPKNIFTVQNCSVFTNDYKLTVTLRLPMPHINSSVDIPIVINGIIPISQQNQVEDAPPSYWEVMAEEQGDSKEEQDESKEGKYFNKEDSD